jgi:uncharacterized protein YqjF (DUF2071 family)
MQHRLTSAGTHHYESRLRRAGRRPGSRVVVRVGPVRPSTPLDTFLTARWGLHVRWWGRTTYIPNRHGRWPLREAEVVTLEDDLLASVGLGELAGRTPDHVAFSEGVHTEFGLPIVRSGTSRP